jgi:hypothetical protein
VIGIDTSSGGIARTGRSSAGIEDAGFVIYRTHFVYLHAWPQVGGAPSNEEERARWLGVPSEEGGLSDLAEVKSMVYVLMDGEAR